jgi:glycosyltransferase involved in cell wall biosynthesis
METLPLPRIAVVAASLDILGGQGVQAYSLVDSLEADGYSVTFLPINPQFPKGLEWVRRVRGLRTVLNELIYAPSLLRLVASDVVHVFSGSYWSFLLAPVPAMILGRLFNKQVVLHYHSGEAEDHLSNWGWLVHPWLRLANELVVPSTYLQEVFGRHGLHAHVIANVVDLSRFRFHERRPLRPRLLSTRNLERYYRVDTIIEAFAHFKSEVPAATLTIAGYGSQERGLRDLVASLGLASVEFVGKVDPNDMPALYAAHDIFVNASELDNQPVSLLEAFASGLPVVSTAAGDIPFMVKNGLKGALSASDPRALSQAIAAVYRNPDGAREMARRAREDVNQFTWPAVRDQWAAIYAERTGVNEVAVGAESR